MQPVPGEGIVPELQGLVSGRGGRGCALRWDEVARAGPLTRIGSFGRVAALSAGTAPGIKADDEMGSERVRPADPGVSEGAACRCGLAPLSSSPLSPMARCPAERVLPCGRMMRVSGWPAAPIVPTRARISRGWGRRLTDRLWCLSFDTRRRTVLPDGAPCALHFEVESPGEDAVSLKPYLTLSILFSVSMCLTIHIL